MRKRLITNVLGVIGMASAFVSPTVLASAEMPLTFSDSGYMMTRWVDVTMSNDGLIAYAAQDSASGYSDKVWKSSNGGAADSSNAATWAEIPSSPVGRWLEIDTSANGEVVFGIASDGVTTTLYRSLDGGENWSMIFANSVTGISDVAVSDSGLKVVVVFGDTTVFYSIDTGDTWDSSITVSGNVNQIDISGDGNTIVSVGATKAYISSDAGASWATRTVTGTSSLSSVNVSEDGVTILVASRGGTDADAWVSTDGGLDFDPAGFSAEYGSSNQGTYSSMSSDGSTMLWAWYGGPIKFSRDGGDSWYTPTETPLRGWLSFAINADGTRGVLSVEGAGGSWNFRRSTLSLNAASPAQGASAFPNRVTLTGTNFYEGCVASIDGVAKVTTFVSSTILRVAIGASGPLSGEFTVECDGLNSNAVDWSYTQQTTTTTTTVATTTGSTLPPTGARGNSSSYWALALLVLGLGLAGFRARSRS